MSLTAFLLLIADVVFHLFPDDAEVARQVRKRTSESIAIQLAGLAQRNELATMEATIKAIAARDTEIRSLAVRRANGEVVAMSGDHPAIWVQPRADQSSLTNVLVPVLSGKEPWGQVELSYAPVGPQSVGEWMRHPISILMAVMLGGGFVLYYWYMRRVLEHLDPTSVIPDRVRMALDTLSEGVLILDPQGRIVLANRGFRKLHPEGEASLLARRASEIPWLAPSLSESSEDDPWSRAMATRTPVTGSYLTIRVDDDTKRVVVNASPILDAHGTPRGCLVTFDDVSELDRANTDLTSALTQLEASKKVIEQQNEELKQLAAIDPLTGCMNRRSFSAAAEPLYNEARANGTELCVMMLDIDKFKAINDTHGHGVGDQVIQQLARIVKATVRPDDLVCRYGGEEFCIALPGVTIVQAQVIAERIRFKVEAQAGPGIRSVSGLKVTSSFGVSSANLGSPDLRGLIEQADQALYHSKQTGRNKVTRFDDMVLAEVAPAAVEATGTARAA